MFLSHRKSWLKNHLLIWEGEGERNMKKHLLFWEGERERNLFVGSFSKCPQQPRLGQAQAGSSLQAFCMGGRVPSSWAITCLPGWALSGSWIWEQSCGLNFGVLIGNTGIPSSFLNTMETPSPEILILASVIQREIFATLILKVLFGCIFLESKRSKS